MHLASIRDRISASTHRTLWLGLSLLVAWVFVGVAWYDVVEGFSTFDATYQVIITLSTVGYAEVQTLDHSGRAFTMVYILFGVGLLFYAATSAAEELVAGRLAELLRRPRALERKPVMENHYVICGFGRVGQAVAEELLTHGETMMVVDTDEQQLAFARLREIPAVLGDATRDATLNEAQVGAAKALIAVTESDAVNTLTTLTGRSINADLFIVAGVQDESARQHLVAAGANRVFSLHQIAGRRIALAALQPMVTAFLDTPTSERREDVRMLAEVLVSDEGSTLAGHTIGDALGRLRTIRVLGIERQGGEFIDSPPMEHALRQGDLLLLYGDQHEIEELRPYRASARRS